MKKLFCLLFSILMLCTSFLPAFAEEVEDFVGGIGEIDCPYGTPTIDGSIDASEGWSAMQPLNKENTDGGWGVLPVEVEGGLWRAYDEENLYIAATIKLPEISLSEEKDWIDGDDDGNKPGWDGDVFIFTLDPLDSLLEAGFLSETSVWYCFGIFEGNIIRTYRTHTNDGEVTDIIPAKGTLTEDGWRFEAAISWETICKDINDVSFGDVEIPPADILKEGNNLSCAMIYYDRRHDNEAEERITYHRYVTIATTCADGTPGIMATPWKIGAYGIDMKLLAKPTVETAQTTKAEETEIVTDDKGNTVTDAKGNKVTQKVNKTTTKKATTGAASGGSAAQTLDMGVVMAIGTLAVSGIGFIASKKKR